MSPGKTIAREWLGRIHSSASDSAPARISVRNVTRGTLVGECIDVADKGPRRRKGLLGHTVLHAGEGLWIVPCESVHTFFMKFALDLIYLDRKRTVIKVRRNVVPWRMSVCLRAHSILELPSGTVLSTGTQRGDSLEIAAAVASSSA